MINHVTVNLETSKKAINDDGFIPVKLPSKGGISALELTARATNGAGGSASYGILAAITKIEIVNLDETVIMDLSATQLYRLITLRDKEAPPLSEGTGAGVIQVVKLPIRFGRGPDDDTMGLDLSKYPDCELKVHYTLNVDGSDGFATKSFEIDVDVRQTENMQAPNYQGRMRLAEVYGDITAVRNPVRIPLNSASRIVGVYIYAYLDGTADNSLIRNISLITNPGDKKLIQASFSDLQERRKPIAGAIITSWLALWVAPGRLGDKPIEPLTAPEIEVNLEELVAAGAVQIFTESISR